MSRDGLGGSKIAACGWYQPFPAFLRPARSSLCSNPVYASRAGIAADLAVGAANGGGPGRRIVELGVRAPCQIGWAISTRIDGPICAIAKRLAWSSSSASIIALRDGAADLSKLLK
jgi:hypothetical protein